MITKTLSGFTKGIDFYKEQRFFYQSPIFTKFELIFG